MLFKRFEDPGLAHYSYALGCPASGQMAVVDPRRDVDGYVSFADDNDLEITHILETHIHADYASGARELAQKTGAEVLVSGHDEGEAFEVCFSHRDFFDGDVLELGSIRIQALHTPGHTPEHLSFLVFDTTRSKKAPMLMLSGDFLFVGSLGRPDLLGDEVKRQLARQLFESAILKIRDLPDGLKIHPAHGAGSLCGSGLSGLPTSTLGFERASNPYLQDLSCEQFMEKILSAVPPFPEYYKRMKRINSEGPQILGSLPGLSPLEVETFRQLAEDEKHLVLDLRDQLAFGGGHIPGAFGLGAGEKLSMWASWVVPYDQPLILVASGHTELQNAVRSLIRVGLDSVRGYLKEGMKKWTAAGFPHQGLPQISVQQLHQNLLHKDPISIVDVRTEQEWATGHIPGATNIMAGYLPTQLERVARVEGPLAVICGSGYRSTVAASLLQRSGLENVFNVSGGMRAWLNKGFPAVRDSQKEAV